MSNLQIERLLLLTLLLQVVQVKREEKAAVKIQAGYRGFQDRQKVKSIK